MSGRVRAHIRTNVVAYVALFFALGLGTAWANHEMIFSDDIVNGEVKKDDLGGNSVLTGKIADGAVHNEDVDGGAITSNKVADGTLTSDDVATNTLTKADLGVHSVGSFELDGTAFRPEDIKAQFSGLSKAYGIPPNAIQSDEISSGTVQRADLADEAQGPLGFEFSDDDTGIICNIGCTEGTLSLPPGFYMIFGKIRAFQDNDEDPLLAVDCELSSGGAAFDHASVTTETTETFAPLTSATLSMQGARLFTERDGVNLNCRDFDVGDASGFDLKIDAIKLGAFG
jgi:hypothetical protein